MTTEVTIKMTTPHNNNDVMVDVLNGEGNVTGSHRVHDGEEVTLLVYDTQSLAVREVDKEVIENNDGTDNVEPAVSDAGDSEG